jgi:hypothetical protein
MCLDQTFKHTIHHIHSTQEIEWKMEMRIPQLAIQHEIGHEGSDVRRKQKWFASTREESLLMRIPKSSHAIKLFKHPPVCIV